MLLQVQPCPQISLSTTNFELLQGGQPSGTKLRARTRDAPSLVSQAHSPLLSWATVVGPFPEASAMLPSRGWWHIHNSGTPHAHARLTQWCQLKTAVPKQPLPLCTGVQQSVPHVYPLSHLHTDTRCPYATPTHTGLHTGRAAAATPTAVLPSLPGAQERAGQAPKLPLSSPALRLLQAAPGAELGLGRETMEGRAQSVPRCQKRWESSKVEKQE